MIDSSLFDFQPWLDEHEFFKFRYAALLKNKREPFQNLFLISQAQKSYVKTFSNQSLLTITQSRLNIMELPRWANIKELPRETYCVSHCIDLMLEDIGKIN